MQFNDETIQALFGVDDAENEQPDRFKTYFFKNKAYQNLRNNLPIRLVVGHKGIGKSALLRICRIEDEEQNRPNILFQPDQFAEVTHKDDFNIMVSDWKLLLLQLISRQYAENYTPVNGKFMSGLIAVLEDYSKKNELNESRKSISRQLISQKKISVYIDDLDRGWEAKPSDIKRLSALLNAIRDIAGSEDGLRFIMALRTDVYQLVRTSDESTDKIEQNVILLEWEQHEILFLMAKRVGIFFDKDVSSLSPDASQQKMASYLHDVIIEKYEGIGKWNNQPIQKVLMSLTRKRPRDLIKLLSAAAKEAFQNNHEKIQSNDVQKILNRYSQERLQDLINEFKSELPAIEDLLYAMRATKRERRDKAGNVFSKQELLQKLSGIMQQKNFLFANSKRATPQDLAEFLYRIEFLTARIETAQGIEKQYYSQIKKLIGVEDFGFKWEVHPAYRWALQPDSQDDIFKVLDI